jgi:hypothetical protein
MQDNREKDAIAIAYEIAVDETAEFEEAAKHIADKLAQNANSADERRPAGDSAEPLQRT